MFALQLKEGMSQTLVREHPVLLTPAHAEYQRTFVQVFALNTNIWTLQDSMFY